MGKRKETGIICSKQRANSRAVRQMYENYEEYVDSVKGIFQSILTVMESVIQQRLYGNFRRKNNIF